MNKEADIIEILREEERLGKLHNKSKNNGIILNYKEKILEDTNKKDAPNKYIDTTNLNELYKTVFENSAVAITITDEKEGIISWNKYTETLLGMNKDDLHMRTVSFLYPPEEWKKIRSENVRQKGMRYHLETKIIKKNKELIDVEISLSVLKDRMGKTMGSIGIIKDATERKQMEKILKESEEKFKQLYEKAPIAYHTLSPNGKITNVNEKWCKILGYIKEEVTGRPIFDFIIENERGTALSSFKEKIQSKKSYTGGHERTYVTKDNKKRIFVINDYFSFDEGDNVKSVHTTMEDITERKQTEEERKRNTEILQKTNQELTEVKEQLSKLNQDLEKKVEERTTEIKKLLKQKDEFISQLGHDLKTPVSILLNVLPVIEETSEKNVKKECELAIQNIKYIKNLITETLKIAELSSLKVILNKIELNLREIVEGVIKNKLIVFEKKNIKFENKIDKKITVTADKLRFEEVISNIIGNAIKYSSEKNRIITVDAKEKENIVTISIKDTGIGMTKEQLICCFDEFYKADKSRHDLDSVGLGLSICKRIVEKHYGKIWAESPGIGKGSTFYITLTSKPEEKQIYYDKKDKFMKQKIMLVDDNTDFTYIVKKRLEKISEKYEVINANSGKECFELLEHGILPDIILLDIMMPDIEGWDVFVKLKEKIEWKEIPVVFLTAKTDSYSKCFGDITADDYIEKPIEIEELKKRIDKVLGCIKNAKKF